MNISSTEAREALSAAEHAAQSLKRAIDQQTSRIVLIWAFVYFFAPLSMHLWPMGGIIPLQLLLMGAIVYSIYNGRRNSPISGPGRWRIGALWGVTFAFAWVWCLILAPDTSSDVKTDGSAIERQMWAYGVSIAMFVYVVMGLWIGRIYIVTGVMVTLVTLIGLKFLGDWYWLWCAVTGGGILLVAGCALRKRGRS